MYINNLQNNFTSFKKPLLLDPFEQWDPDNGMYDFGGTSEGATLTGAGLGGIGGGITGGALAGTAVTPGIGTAIGAIIGGIAGAGAGLLSGGIGGNTPYDLSRDSSGNVRFTPGAGTFYRYTNKSGNNKDLVNHIFWNKNTGEVYYLDPDSGQYSKLDTSGLDMSGGMFHYASDAQLNNASDAIARIISNNRNIRRLEEARRSYESNPSDGLASVPIPTPFSNNSIQQLEYTKRKLEADLLLQKMLTTDADIETAPDTTSYYKYGSNEIDLKYYLHNLGTNLQKYLNSQDWSEALKLAFLKSYETYKNGLSEQLNTKSSRFSTDDAGNILDTNALLSGDIGRVVVDTNGNVYNSIDEIKDKKLRKTAVEFSPNQEVANYFNTVGQAIVSSGKTRLNTSESTGEFDLNKHGFMNYWVNKVNPAGGLTDMDPYFALDPVGPDGKRERTNRTKYLVNELTNYLNRIKRGSNTFENTSFKTKDTYIAKIQLAIDNLNNGWDTTDPASLQAIGISPEFYLAFMTEKANPLMTELEVSAEAEKRKAEAASDYISLLKTKYDRFATSRHTYTKETNNEFRFSKDPRYTSTEEGMKRIRVALENLGYPADPTNLNTSAELLWMAVKSALRGGETQVSTNVGLRDLKEIIPIILPVFEPNFSELSDGVKYLNDPEDSRYGAILCLEDGKLYYKFIGDVKQSQAWIKLKNEFNTHYNASSDKPKYSFDKLGGILRKFAEGGGMEIDEETLAALLQMADAAESSAAKSPSSSEGLPLQENGAIDIAKVVYGKRQEAAKLRGMSYERYNAKLRSPNSPTDIYNKDNGIWKLEDYVRLGAIAADIASIPLPSVYGAAVGFGGTLANLWADWADDTVTTGELIKNLGANLGFDALSIIPVFGDVADAGRLTRNLVKMAPKIGYALSAYGMLATLKNGSNIMDSLAKVTSDEKLTVGDYQNIAQAIAALAGVNGAIKGHVGSNIAKNNARNTDAIGLGLRKAGTTEPSSDFIILGSKAKEIREIINKGGDTKEVAAAINAKLKEIDGFGDYEVNTNLETIPVGARLPIGRELGTDNKKHLTVRNPFHTKSKIDSFEIYNHDGNGRIAGGYTSLNLHYLDRQVAAEKAGRSSSPKTVAEVLATTETVVKEQLEEVINANKRATELNAADIARRTELEEKQNATKSELEGTTKTEADTSRAELEALYSKYKVEDADRTGFDKLEKALNKSKKSDLRIQTEEDAIKALKKDKKFAESEIKALIKARKTATPAEKTEINNDILVWKKSIVEIDEKISKHELNILEKTDWERDSAVVKKLKDILEYKDGTFLSKLELRLRQELDLLDPEIRQLDDLIKLFDKISKAEWNPDPNSGTHSPEMKAFLEKHPTLTLHVEGRDRDISEILKNMGLFRKGGRFENFNKKALKAKHGVLIKEDNGWYRDIFSNYADTIVDRIRANRDYYQIINDKQGEHAGLYRDAETSGNWKNNAYEGKNNSVGNYQNWYHNEGFNTLGIAPNYQKRYSFLPATRRNTRDNPQGFENYTADNLYSSITDDRRVLGRLGDWNEELLKAFNDRLKEFNLYVDLDNRDNYYKIYPMSPPLDRPTPTPSPETPKVEETGLNPDLLSMSSLDGVTITSPISGRKSLTSKDNPKILGILRGFGRISPEVLSGLRYGLLTLNNIRAAEIGKAAEIPFYLNPKVDNVFVYGDNEALKYGEKRKSDLTSVGYNNPVTSDGVLQLEFIKELNRKGQEYADEGKKQDTAMWRTTLLADLAQRKENHTNEHLVSEQNRLAGIKTIANKLKIDAALRTQIGTNIDTALQEMEYNAKTKRNQAKADADSRALAEISLAVQNDPNKYGAGLSSQELAVYNKVLAGTAPSSMSASDQSLLISANRKVSFATTNQYYAYKGVPSSTWSKDAAKLATAKPSVQIELTPAAKDGTKLAIAKIRNKAKNADRFQKSVLKLLESLDKKLDRISRSMYGLPKSEMVKPK